MTIAISSHATLVEVQATPGSAFTTIAELGDITPPEMMRNEFDATTQNINIDAYVLGVLRRGQLSVPINFLPTNATHDHLTGLYALLIANTITGYRITFPDATSLKWVMSGQVQSIKPANPVDGKLSAVVTIRVSGLMTIGGVTVGS